MQYLALVHNCLEPVGRLQLLPDGIRAGYKICYEDEGLLTGAWHDIRYMDDFYGRCGLPKGSACNYRMQRLFLPQLKSLSSFSGVMSTSQAHEIMSNVERDHEQECGS